MGKMKFGGGGEWVGETGKEKVVGWVGHGMALLGALAGWDFTAVGFCTRALHGSLGMGTPTSMYHLHLSCMPAAS